MMASKTIRICDRCNAQFDMSDAKTEQHPTSMVNVQIPLGPGSGTVEEMKELCKPCRTEFIALVRKFFG